MKKLTIILSFLFGLSYAQTPNLQWAKQMGASAFDFGNSITVDNSGNVYAVGGFTGTVDFDPGPGTFTLATTSNKSDIFISKLDASGNFVWAKQIGGVLDDGVYSIKLDASNNLYITGDFQGTADFDPSVSTYTFASLGGWDTFILKLDASGNFVWAKQIGGSGGETGYSIALDATGNVYTFGTFSGNVDFDPGIGVSTLTAVGSADSFISKLDNSGNFVFAKGFGGTLWVLAKSITIDNVGNIYTTGIFEGTADFDPGVGTYTLSWTTGSLGSSYDFFVSKLDALGNFSWAKQIGGGGNSCDYSAYINTDPLGNVYTTGGFQGIVDFDPGVATYTMSSSGPDDIHILKLDASGNFVWAKQMCGTSFAMGRSLAIDAASNIYISGEFQGTVDFDPSISVLNLTAFGNSDIYISKLDASGNFVFALQMGGTLSDGATCLTLDAAGNIYTTGYFSGTSDFDPSPSTFSLTSAGSADVFINKISQGPTNVNEYVMQNNIHVFPNPTNSEINLVFNNITKNASFKLLNVAGQTLIEKTNISVDKLILDISEQPSAVYFLQIYSDGNILTTKIVKD